MSVTIIHELNFWKHQKHNIINLNNRPEACTSLKSLDPKFVEGTDYDVDAGCVLLLRGPTASEKLHHNEKTGKMVGKNRVVEFEVVTEDPKPDPNAPTDYSKMTKKQIKADTHLSPLMKKKLLLERA